jgi:hypothetical protein
MKDPEHKPYEEVGNREEEVERSDDSADEDIKDPEHKPDEEVGNREEEVKKVETADQDIIVKLETDQYPDMKIEDGHEEMLDRKANNWAVNEEVEEDQNIIEKVEEDQKINGKVKDETCILLK